jgi:hypothetical protein
MNDEEFYRLICKISGKDDLSEDQIELLISFAKENFCHFKKLIKIGLAK